MDPFSTMVPQFSHVVDYRRYLLIDKRNLFSANQSMDLYDCKRRIDGLHPTLGSFMVNPPMKLFKFL